MSTTGGVNTAVDSVDSTTDDLIFVVKLDNYRDYFTVGGEDVLRTLLDAATQRNQPLSLVCSGTRENISELTNKALGGCGDAWVVPLSNNGEVWSPRIQNNGHIAYMVLRCDGAPRLGNAFAWRPPVIEARDLAEVCTAAERYKRIRVASPADSELYESLNTLAAHFNECTDLLRVSRDYSCDGCFNVAVVEAEDRRAALRAKARATAKKKIDTDSKSAREKLNKFLRICLPFIETMLFGTPLYCAVRPRNIGRQRHSNIVRYLGKRRGIRESDAYKEAIKSFTTEDLGILPKTTMVRRCAYCRKLLRLIAAEKGRMNV